MKKYKTSAKILLAATYFLFAALIVLIFLLPRGAFWYTNIKHRPETLPTVLISTCYPCVPLAFIALLAVRKIAKNILEDKIFTKSNQKNFFYFGLCCLIAGLIMFVAGFFYFPFFIASGAALFCALFTKVITDVFSIHIADEQDEQDEADEDAEPDETPEENSAEEENDSEENLETKEED